MNVLDQALELRALGFAPVYQKGKAAFHPGWNTKIRSPEELRQEYKPGLNVAVITGLSAADGKRLAVIDVDVRSEAYKKEAWAAVQKITGKVQPTTRTGGGGAHFWFWIPSDNFPAESKIVLAQSRETVGTKPAWTVELLANGHACTTPPSIHPSGKPYEWVNGGASHVPDAPESLILAINEAREKVKEGKTVQEFDEPIMFGAQRVPELSADFLPSSLRDYAHALAKSTQTPLGLTVMMLLSALATCLQRRFEVAPYGDDYREPLCIWTVTALPPASRKTAVVSAVTRPLLDYEREQAEHRKVEFAQKAAERAVNLDRIKKLQADAAKCDDAIERDRLIREVADLQANLPPEVKPPRLILQDVTPEQTQNALAEYDERISVISDEGGMFEILSGIYSDGRANIDVFLQAHAGQSVRVDRSSRTVNLERPALTFGLTVQPAVINDLSQGSKRRFRGVGILARYLYCLPESNIGLRNVRQREPVPNSVASAYYTKIMELLSIRPEVDEAGRERPRILTLNTESLELWHAFAESIEVRQGKGGELEDIQDWTGKLPGAALRIAGLCAVAKDRNNLTIDAATMGGVLDFCEDLIKHAQAAFSLMGEDQDTKDAEVVHSWALRLRKAEFSQSECHKALHGRFRKVDRLMKALGVLIDRNLISPPIRLDTPRKATTVYRINPAVLEAG